MGITIIKETIVKTFSLQWYKNGMVLQDLEPCQ